MPHRNCDPVRAAVDPLGCAGLCPKCGVEMESIEIGVQVLALEQLRLCPGCYLVTWIDHNERHIRQGVAMKKGFHFSGEDEWMTTSSNEC